MKAKNFVSFLQNIGHWGIYFKIEMIILIIQYYSEKFKRLAIYVLSVIYSYVLDFNNSDFHLRVNFCNLAKVPNLYSCIINNIKKMWDLNFALAPLKTSKANYLFNFFISYSKLQNKDWHYLISYRRPFQQRKLHQLMNSLYQSIIS